MTSRSLPAPGVGHSWTANSLPLGIETRCHYAHCGWFLSWHQCWGCGWLLWICLKNFQLSKITWNTILPNLSTHRWEAGILKWLWFRAKQNTHTHKKKKYKPQRWSAMGCYFTEISRVNHSVRAENQSKGTTLSPNLFYFILFSHIVPVFETCHTLFNFLVHDAVIVTLWYWDKLKTVLC